MTKGTKLKWLFGYEVSQVPVRLRVTKESKEGKGSVVLAIVIHKGIMEEGATLCPCRGAAIEALGKFNLIAVVVVPTGGSALWKSHCCCCN